MGDLVGSYLEVSSNMLMLDMIGIEKGGKNEISVPYTKSSLMKTLHDIISH